MSQYARNQIGYADHEEVKSVDATPFLPTEDELHGQLMAALAAHEAGEPVLIPVNLSDEDWAHVLAAYEAGEPNPVLITTEVEVVPNEEHGEIVPGNLDPTGEPLQTGGEGSTGDASGDGTETQGGSGVQTPSPDETELTNEEDGSQTVVSAEVRQWASENGIELPARGNLRNAVVDAFVAKDVDALKEAIK